MKQLFTEEEYNNAKIEDTLPLECYHCGDIFQSPKYMIQKAFNPNTKKTSQFCSTKCHRASRKIRVSVNCTNCNITIEKTPSQIKKSKTGNHFCSLSCSTQHNNKNKTHGTRRSKLETWLEDQLIKLYPQLDIKFNQKEVIGSELDIYIPSLNVAFELNGIFHYEPIFGVDKLEQIRKNDHSKTKACVDAKIDLCTIDTSQQSYVKPSTSKPYLNIINKIINERLLS